MPRLSFCVPVHHDRVPLANICLRQLRRTCDALKNEGVEATAVIVSDRDTLAELDPPALGFAWTERDNDFLSRRYNDAIELACNPALNPRPADYVVPFGSDDWADHRIFLLPLPGPYTIHGFKTISVVREDGQQIATSVLNHEGGWGIRIIPRELVAPLAYRPADEDRKAGCDTSILHNLERHHGARMTVKHWHLHDQQIVDWKSQNVQVHSYRDVTAFRQSAISDDPFTVLADFYPADALDEMRQHYGLVAA